MHVYIYFRCDNKVNVVTTFLVGAEALEEAVGDLKLQLAPKTNFLSSAAGAWNLMQTVKDMLKPTVKTTVLEIGCGIGVLGLSLASVSNTLRNLSESVQVCIYTQSEIHECIIKKESEPILMSVAIDVRCT